MSLSEFLDLWTLKNLLVIVFDYSVYEEVWEKIFDGQKIERFGYEPEFSYLPKWSQLKSTAFLNDTFANAPVKQFTITSEGMIIFIEKE